tara:strand:- start:15345 stop:15830 length:486 start_codon:yes stop_codon:yes gene_type:complete
MTYAEFAASDAYVEKKSGSHISIVMFDEKTPTQPLIGAATGINATDDFETLPVEEAGEEGTNEIVQGRHTINLTVNAFWTPQRNDQLPTRQNFIDREFTILEQVAPLRSGHGTVLNAYEGAKLSRNGSSHGARGLKSVDLAFQALRRYNGQEWADKTGGGA